MVINYLFTRIKYDKTMTINKYDHDSELLHFHY